MENKADKDLEIIVRFFNMELSEEELEGFEKRLTNDQAFAEKVDIYEESQSLVNETFGDSVQAERTEQWKEAIRHPESSGRKFRYLSIAAAILVLLIAWQGYQFLSAPDYQALVENAWQKEVGLDYYAVRSNNPDEYRQEFLKGFDLFKAGKYQGSIQQLEKIANVSPYFEDAMLIIGLSQYKKGDSEGAINTLEGLKDYPTNKNAKTAQWYLGLIFLENDDLDNASKWLILPQKSNEEILLKE